MTCQYNVTGGSICSVYLRSDISVTFQYNVPGGKYHFNVSAE